MVDVVRVLSDLARLKSSEKKAIYKRVFRGEDGLFVLLDMAVTHGRLGKTRGPDATPHQSIYANGQQDTVLAILTAAGIDAFQFSAYLAGLDEAKRALRSASEEGIEHVDPEKPVVSDDDERRWRDRSPIGGDPEPLSPDAAAIRDAFRE